MGEPIHVWGIGASAFEERYLGEYASREAAIEAGRAEYEGAAFAIISGTKPVASHFAPSVGEWLVDGISENAGEEFGDVTEDFPVVSEEALAELDGLVAAWADRHIKVDFWQADGPAELIPAVEGWVDPDAEYEP